MAKTSYVDVLYGLEDSFFAGLKVSDRFQYSRLVKKTALYSVTRKKGVSARSLLSTISALWAGFSPVEKTAWNDAADVQKEVYNSSDFIIDNAFYGKATFGLARYGKHISLSNSSGWRLFVQDQCARIKNDIAGVATPSLLHQAWVGNLKLGASGAEFKIVQLHPRFYWIYRKVAGKKGMYEPVPVIEDLELPVVITLNYKSDLSVVSSPNFAKFYARFWYSFEGVNSYYDLEIPLDYSSVWKTASATLTVLSGYAIGYELYFNIKGLTGDLFIDNAQIVHSFQNWARDSYCNDIDQGFTKGFYQIPAHWAAILLPSDSSFESIYKDF